MAYSDLHEGDNAVFNCGALSGLRVIVKARNFNKMLGSDSTTFDVVFANLPKELGVFEVPHHMLVLESEYEGIPPESAFGIEHRAMRYFNIEEMTHVKGVSALEFLTRTYEDLRKKAMQHALMCQIPEFQNRVVYNVCLMPELAASSMSSGDGEVLLGKWGLAFRASVTARVAPTKVVRSVVRMDTSTREKYI